MRRPSRTIKLIAALLLTGLGALFSELSSTRAIVSPPQTGSPEKQSSQNEVVIVEHVSDGDTLQVRYRGIRERVRLVGIDAPESSDNEKARRDSRKHQQQLSHIISQGQRASRYLQDLVRPGDQLRIEFDVEPRDRYDRILGYLFLPSGELLNEKLVAEGYAYPYTAPPNVKYAKRIKAAFAEAREKNRGLWE